MYIMFTVQVLLYVHLSNEIKSVTYYVEIKLHVAGDENKCFCV